MSRTINTASCLGYHNARDLGYCQNFVESYVNNWERDSSARLSCDYELNAYWTGNTTAFQLAVVCEGRSGSTTQTGGESVLEYAPDYLAGQNK